MEKRAVGFFFLLKVQAEIVVGFAGLIQLSVRHGDVIHDVRIVGGFVPQFQETGQRVMKIPRGIMRPSQRQQNFFVLRSAFRRLQKIGAGLPGITRFQVNQADAFQDVGVLRPAGQRSGEIIQGGLGPAELIFCKSQGIEQIDVLRIFSTAARSCRRRL